MLSRSVKFTPNIGIPMRDGVVLRADLFRPDDDAAYPVVLARTPYGKQLADPPRPWLRFAAAGYNVVVQDCRGRFASDGVFYPFQDEMNDGYDTVEWVASQPWSTGSVGMFGTSYLGVTQWMAAAAAPPHLKTIVPIFTASDYHDGWIYQSGALLLAFALGWAMGSFATHALSRAGMPNEKRRGIADSLVDLADRHTRTMSHLPLADVPVLNDHGLAPYFRDWLDHPDEDDYWTRWDISRYHPTISIPVLAIGGWYDMFLGGTLKNYVGMREKSGAATAAQQHLVIGPWNHSMPQFGANPSPEVKFGARSSGGAIDLEGRAVRWFDRWLKEEDNGVTDEPPLTIFSLGANRWREASSWPLPDTRFVEFFFGSAGAANSAAGDGRLSTDAPGDEPPDVFLYNPRRPVPTRGGGSFGHGGAWDQREIEARADVLVYTSEPLADDLDVTGPVKVTLWASSTATDTDFTAKLVDVWPDGLAMNLADNIVRARYRESKSAPTLIEPGKPYEYTIDLYGISNVFKKGHRVRVEISSSNFPRFDRNPNTGGEFGRETELRSALQTVFHDATRPSRIRLPVVG